MLQKLQPHYSDWLRIPDSELYRSWRPGNNERLFVYERKRWRAANSLMFVEIGQPVLALRRRQPAPHSTPVAAPPPAQAEPSLPRTAALEWPPAVSVFFPEFTHCAHTKPCGCRYGPVDLETEREVEWRGQDAWLRVHGSSKRAQALQLAWAGPTRGSANVRLDEAGYWSHRIPVKPGEYRLEVTALGPGGQGTRTVEPVRIIHHQRIVDLAYDTKTRRFIGVPYDLRDALREAARPLDKAIQDWLEAARKKGGDAQEKARKESELHRILQQVAGGPIGGEAAGGKPLRELIHFREKRWSYVSDQEVEQMLRRAPVVDTRKEREHLVRNGRLSTERLLERMRKKLQDQRTLEFEYDSEPAWKDMNEWARGFNQNPDLLLYEYRDENDQPVFRVTDEVRMLRYTAGVGASGKFNLEQGEASFHAAAQAELAALQGEMKASLWLPNENGHVFNALVPLKRPEGGQTHRAVDLCTLRARIEGTLSGYAGASACASLDLEFDMGRGGKPVVMRGVENPAVIRQKKDKRFKARAIRKDSAFVGIRAGAELTGAVEWDNPDHREGWQVLGELGAEGQLQAGLGLEREYAIVFEKGLFHLLFKASAAFGVGCGGEFHCKVGYEHIASLLMHVYQQLMRADFDKLLFVQELAFEYLYQVHLKAIWKGAKNLQEIYSEGFDIVFDWWDEITERLTDASMNEKKKRSMAEELAVHINNGRLHLDHMAPETKGHLLRVLCHTSIFSMEEAQERAIIRVLETIRCRRDFQETLEHMTYDGSRIPQAEGRRLLESILDGAEHHQFDELLLRWQMRLAHLDNLPDRAPYGQAVAGLTNGVENIA
ncbi:MAG: hypothetical protein D6717_13545 [Gammaproteobacteria bacterium]|nr:MAG: hypothetical protein D6717_13545 [Gammaproteobacteria bacterium]